MPISIGALSKASGSNSEGPEELMETIGLVSSTRGLQCVVCVNERIAAAISGLQCV